MKQHYLFKLVPPRPGFAIDMSEAERTVMNFHIDYFNKLVNTGMCLLFGPVMDTSGAYELAVLEAESDEAARQIGLDDPSVKAAISTFEIFPMMVSNIRKEL